MSLVEEGVRKRLGKRLHKDFFRFHGSDLGTFLSLWQRNRKKIHGAQHQYFHILFLIWLARMLE